MFYLLHQYHTLFHNFIIKYQYFFLPSEKNFWTCRCKRFLGSVGIFLMKITLSFSDPLSPSLSVSVLFSICTLTSTSIFCYSSFCRFLLTESFILDDTNRKYFLFHIYINMFFFNLKKIVNCFLKISGIYSLNWKIHFFFVFSIKIFFGSSMFGANFFSRQKVWNKYF